MTQLSEGHDDPKVRGQCNHYAIGAATRFRAVAPSDAIFDHPRGEAAESHMAEGFLDARRLAWETEA
jgi:hypothetical protein